MGVHSTNTVDKRLVHDALARRLFGAESSPALLAGHHVVRRIGAGGMGLVFEVRDPRSGRPLALKILRHRSPIALLRLKREFRVLAQLHHPNLVRFNELLVEHDEPCITMELVRGGGLLEHVQEGGQVSALRLRNALRQLVDAVSALHDARIVHRDLKLSNLLVEPNGRLVVLDMGLAMTLEEVVENGPSTSGTPFYMAPERIEGGPCTEAGDWFSVGVMLYRMLGGPIPSGAEASTFDLAAAQQWLAEDESPGLWELNALCRRLIDRLAARRPQAAELRTCLGLPPTPARASLHAHRPDALFVGRDAELELLARAFARAEAGACVVVHVTGEPGIGKTELVRHFIGQLLERRALLVLSSRCHARELIPYNAFDGAIDALGRELEHLTSLELDQLCGEFRPELARLFPSLQEALQAPACVVWTQTPNSDPHAARERGFTALRGLLRGLAAERPLVLHLDDLQWGSADSAHLIRALLQTDPPAPLLLIASYRAEDAEHNAGVRALREVSPAVFGGSLALGALDPAPALQLATALADPSLGPHDLARLAQESAGSPLFLRLLVQQRRSGGVGLGKGTNLPALLLSLVDALPAPSRLLLELCAVAGCALPHGLLFCAAQAGRPYLDWEEHTFILQRSGLLRCIQRDEGEVLDSYHDRIREIVVDSIAHDQRRERHRALVDASLQRAVHDDAFLARQCEGAGQLERAAEFAERAGDDAFAAVAFEDAAEYYAMALRYVAGARPHALVAKLADALAYAGQCSGAAPLYVEAAGNAELERSLSLRLRAAEMFMRCGQVEQCIEVARPVLRSVGLRYPASASLALLSAVLEKPQISSLLRRMDIYAERPEPSALDRLRIEVCFTLGYRLATTDIAFAAALLVRGTITALRSGTLSHRARALAGYALMLAGTDRDRPRQEWLLDTSWELARRANDPEVKAWVLFLRAVTYSRTRFYDSLNAAREGQRWIASHCVDSAWLLQELDFGICAHLLLTGEVAELARASETGLLHAQQNGDAFATARMQALRSWTHLAADRPLEALAELEQVLAAWSNARTFYITALATWVKVRALLYRRDGAQALEVIEASRRAYRKAGYFRIQPWTIILTWLEATTALCCAQQRFEARHVRMAERSLARLSKQQPAWSTPVRALVEAGLARLRGRSAQARDLYRAAAEHFETQHMAGYAAVARLRHAELLGGEEGRAMAEQPTSWLRAQGIVNVEQWVHMEAP